MAAIFATTRSGAALLALLAAMGLASAAPAAAQGRDRPVAVTRDMAPGEAAAPRRRAPLRVRVHRAPAGTALARPCVAWYVEEARPSGTVIVPRMQCWWARR